MDEQVGLDVDYRRPVFLFIQRERNFMRTTNLFHGAMGIHLCTNKETGYRAGWCVCGGLVVGGCVGGCMVCGSILHL